MPDSAMRPVPVTSLRQMLEEVASASPRDEWDYGVCRIRDHAQDQAIIEVSRGREVETYSGLRRSQEPDPQSEALPDFHIASWHMEASVVALEEWLSGVCTAWDIIDSHHSLDIEEATGDLQATSEQTRDELFDAILAHAALGDWQKLKDLIFAAEDTAFAIEQGERLGPRLLDLAVQHRDSDDPQDKPAVWSAIRTGGSMLRPDQAIRLRPLLDPGHPIETSLVAVKMIGRIFEAQPPADTDQHPALASDVCRIAESLMNPYAIASSQSAAMVQLAIYALAAMASTETLRIAEAMHGLRQEWFARQTCRELRQLQERWRSLPGATAPAPRRLLDKAISTLAAA